LNKLFLIFLLFPVLASASGSINFGDSNTTNPRAIANTHSIQNITPVTYVAWTKQTATYAVSDAGVIVLIPASDTVEEGIWLTRHVTSAGIAKVSSEGRDATSSTRARSTNTVTIPQNQWQHFAGVYPSNSTRTAYLNGDFAGTAEGVRNPTSLTRISIGNRPGNRTFPGNIAHAAIWNRVLAQSEIKALADGANPLEYYDGLLHYWPGTIIRINNADFMEDVIGGAHARLENGAKWVADKPNVNPAPIQGDGTAKISWVAPTQREDGKTLSRSEIKEFRIYWGLDTTYNRTTVVAGGLNEHTIIGLSPGTYNFRMTAVDTSGLESKYSPSASKTIIELDSLPKPPSNLVMADIMVYTVVKQVNRFIMLPVGTAPSGTPCISEQSVNQYFAIPRETVTWSGTVRPDVVVALCE
jgi:hypothetical protein